MAEETQDQQESQVNFPALLTEIRSIQITENYRVTSQPEAEAAAGDLVKVARLAKQVEAGRKEALKPLLEATEQIRMIWREPETLLEAAKTTLKGAISAWQAQVQEAARKAAIEAEQAAAAARAKVAAEEAARAAAARQKSEETAAAAAAAEAAGDQAAAAKLTEQAAGLAERADIIDSGASAKIAHVELGAPPVEGVAKFTGVSTRQKWTGEVRNLRQFLTSILADPHIDLESLISIKPSELNKLAGTYKLALSEKFPGAVARPESVVSARTK